MNIFILQANCMPETEFLLLFGCQMAAEQTGLVTRWDQPRNSAHVPAKTLLCCWILPFSMVRRVRWLTVSEVEPCQCVVNQVSMT